METADALSSEPEKERSLSQKVRISFIVDYIDILTGKTNTVNNQAPPRKDSLVRCGAKRLGQQR
jgi:hypothetical protein